MSRVTANRTTANGVTVRRTTGEVKSLEPSFEFFARRGAFRYPGIEGLKGPDPIVRQPFLALFVYASLFSQSKGSIPYIAWC
jgi:hypothetical protein